MLGVFNLFRSRPCFFRPFQKLIVSVFFQSGTVNYIFCLTSDWITNYSCRALKSTIEQVRNVNYGLVIFIQLFYWNKLIFKISKKLRNSVSGNHNFHPLTITSNKRRALNKISKVNQTRRLLNCLHPIKIWMLKTKLNQHYL